MIAYYYMNLDINQKINAKSWYRTHRDWWESRGCLIDELCLDLPLVPHDEAERRVSMPCPYRYETKQFLY